MIRHLSVNVFFACLACCSHATAEDWPQFRGPGGQGTSTETGLATTWSGQQHLAWKVALPGAGASSPITLGDRIFVTCYSGYGTDQDSGSMEDLKLHVVCLDAGDGSLVWNTTIPPTLPEERRIRDHGYAAATPATDGEHIYVFLGKSGLLKLDLAGKQLWRTSVGSGTHGWGCGTSPVLFEDLVIVNASVESGNLVAVKKETGEIAWRAAGMNRSWNTPHLVRAESGRDELVVSVKGKIIGFAPRTGEQLWSCDGIDDYVCPSIVSKDGVVFAIGGRTSMALAIRAGGRGDVSDTHLLWTARVGANVSSPVIWGEHLYWVSDRNRTAYCVRTADGQVMYQQRFPAQPYASAMAADGKLYVVSRYDGTFVLAAQPNYQQLSHNQFDDDSVFNASPVVAGGNLYLRSDKYLYCVREG